MREFIQHVREGVRDLKAYQPGRPLEEVRKELDLERVVKLASNEAPEGPSPAVRAALLEEMGHLHRYPDGGTLELTGAVAARYQIDQSELVFGNGADELVRLIIQALCGPDDEVVFPHPSFPSYGIGSKAHFDIGQAIGLDENLKLDLDAMSVAVGEKTRLVFLCNPNNPTGSWHSHAIIESFLEKIPPRVVVILDEAYVEFATDPEFPRFFDLRKRFPNLASLRSFSKAYALAALRVGYLMGDPALIDLLRRTRPPFNVNRLAQRAATVAIGQPELVVVRAKANAERREKLEAGIKAAGAKPWPSQGNFLFVNPPAGHAQISQRLLEHGVIVRPMGGFGYRDGSFRVSVGLPEENEFFLTALREILGR